MIGEKQGNIFWEKLEKRVRQIRVRLHGCEKVNCWEELEALPHGGYPINIMKSGC